MKSLVLFFLSLGISIPALSADPTTCPEKVERQGGSIQIQQSLTSEGVCFLSVGNYKIDESGVYRNYLFTSTGELMIFNSYSWGEDASSTGAREFYFFPRNQNVARWAWNSEERVLKVQAVSGDVFVFDYEDGQLKAMNNGRVILAPEVRPDNKGGIEILNYQGLLLDGGFKMGSAPTGRSKGVSQFRDSTGSTCNVVNSSLFNYLSDGEVSFKFNDKGLKSFLARQCPRIQF